MADKKDKMVVYFDDGRKKALQKLAIDYDTSSTNIIDSLVGFLLDGSIKISVEDGIVRLADPEPQSQEVR